MLWQKWSSEHIKTSFSHWWLSINASATTGVLERVDMNWSFNLLRDWHLVNVDTERGNKGRTVWQLFEFKGSKERSWYNIVAGNQILCGDWWPWCHDVWWQCHSGLTWSLDTALMLIGQHFLTNIYTHTCWTQYLSFHGKLFKSHEDLLQEQLSYFRYGQYISVP